MPRVSSANSTSTASLKRPARKKASVVLKRLPAKKGKPAPPASAKPGLTLGAIVMFAGVLIVYLGMQIHAQYTFSLQSPLVLRFQSPLVVAHRTKTQDAAEAQFDQQGRSLSAYQQYACQKFGNACRVALAIQRAENPQGKCEIYHYNSDGTLDWGYFQINTVHLQRPGLNLRDLLDCRANIDFAYRLYLERRNFTAWSTYNNGAYRRFLRE